LAFVLAARRRLARAGGVWVIDARLSPAGVGPRKLAATGVLPGSYAVMGLDESLSNSGDAVGGPVGAIQPLLARLLAVPGDGVGCMLCLRDMFDFFLTKPKSPPPSLSLLLLVLLPLCLTEKLRVTFGDGGGGE
jgi:hypothetical protein